MLLVGHPRDNKYLERSPLTLGPLLKPPLCNIIYYIMYSVSLAIILLLRPIIVLNPNHPKTIARSLFLVE